MNKHKKNHILPYSVHIDQTNNLTEKDSLSDKDLWYHFQIKEEWAFIEIYNRYSNQLYNYGCQLSVDNELIKDCVQDFFIYLRKKRGKFGSTDSIKFYLLRSFKRIILRSLKKSSKELKIKKKFSFSQFPIELSSETVLINKQIEEIQIRRLNTALLELNEREREAIYYFYYVGLSYEQIADIFGYSHVSSGRRLIYTALIHLRKFFPLTILIEVIDFLHK